MRKFSNRLSLYNIKTGELKENIAIEHAYAIENYYDDEIEKKLNRQVESQFGDLLSNYILKCEREISLSRKQLYLVKKFLLISLLRSIHAEEFMQKESKVAEDGEKAAQCYIRFLKNNYEQKYDVIDIDEDGISELLTLNEGSSAAMYRYDSKKDKVKELHSYQLGKASTMYYSKEKHQVVFITGDTGGGEFDTYKYVDGELKKIETLIWHNGKFEEEGYTYNGEKISIEEGDEYLEVMKEQYQSLRGEM